MNNKQMTTWLRYSHWDSASDPSIARIRECLDREEVALGLRDAEAEGVYPAGTLEALGDCGLWDFFAPGASASTSLHLNALAAATAFQSGSLAISVCISALALLPLYVAGSAEQLKRFARMIGEGKRAALGLTEWDHGSDLAGCEATATRDATGYLLNGRKSLINASTQAEIISVLVRTKEAQTGSMLGRSQGMSMFIFEKNETIRPITRYKTLPMRAADIGGFDMVNTHVAEGDRLGEEGAGFSVVKKTLAISRGGVSPLAAGTSSRLTALCSAYLTERTIYGKPLLELWPARCQFVRARAFELATNCMSLKVSALTNYIGQGASYYAGMAKFICSEMAESCAREGRYIFSARSLVAGDFETASRDVLLYAVFDGTRQVMLELSKEHLRQFLTRSRNTSMLSTLKKAYSIAPVPIEESVRRGRRAEIFSISTHAQELSSMGGTFRIGHLAAICSEIVAQAELSLTSGEWKRGSLAEDLTKAAALLEAALAVAELADPKRREILEARPIDSLDPLDITLAEFTISLLCREAASDILRVASLRADVSAQTRIVEAIAECEQIYAKSGDLLIESVGQHDG